MIKESVGMDRKAIKLFMKVLLIMKHHICIAYRISQISFRGIEDEISGTGQGNIVLVNIWRDTSGLNINSWEWRIRSLNDFTDHEKRRTRDSSSICGWHRLYYW